MGRIQPNYKIKVMEIQTKIKPWGKEIWFSHTEKFAGKLLHVNKGHRYSLQYHERKIETQYLYEGKIKFTYGESVDNLHTKILNPGDKMDITPGIIHRAEALEDSMIIEVSSPELDDVVKLDDDYGRTGKGNDETLDQKLAEESKKY